MGDRRQAVRVPWVTEVECEEFISGKRHPGVQLSNISLTGLFLNSVPVQPEGTILLLRFTLPSLKLVVAAVVVHSSPGEGMGLTFLDLTPLHRVVIEEVVESDDLVEPDALAELEALAEPKALAEPDALAELEALVEPEALVPAPGPPEPPEAPQRMSLGERSGDDSRDAGQAERAGVVSAPPVAAEELAPRASGPEPDTARGDHPTEPRGWAASEKRPRRVLVVDDHDRTRLMLRGMIEGKTKEFVVTEARDGEECLQIASEQPPFDLIFLDVDMPRLDGLGACRQLRARGVTSPIIFLTGRNELDDFRAGREAGADTYVKKPILVGTLRSMLGLFTSGSMQRR